jgi:hypothetical protein
VAQRIKTERKKAKATHRAFRKDNSTEIKSKHFDAISIHFYPGPMAASSGRLIDPKKESFL